MKKLLNRKEALGMIDAIFTSLHFNLISIKDLGIENSKERDYFLAEAWKIDQGRLKKDYEQTVNSLDAIGFKEYYKLIGKFATKYKIGCWKEYNEYEPILIEELNEELRKYDKTEDKLELINSFTVDELQSESFIFDSKVQVLYDILDDFNVGNKKEEGINTVLESFNSSDKASFIAKLQTDKNLLNALIDKVNGNEKNQLLTYLYKFLSSADGFGAEEYKLPPKAGFDAKYKKGKVIISTYYYIDRKISRYKYRYIEKNRELNPFTNVTFCYGNDQNEITVPAIVLVKSRGDVVLYDDFYKSNIDWKSLTEEKKRELYTEFVLHYLPKELGDAAVGNPVTFIIMLIVGAVIAKAGAVIAACASLIGTGFSAVNIIEGCKLITKVAEGYDSISDVNAAKVSAKDCARGIALLGVEIIPVLFGLIKRGFAKYNGKEIKVGENARARTQNELADIVGRKITEVDKDLLKARGYEVLKRPDGSLGLRRQKGLADKIEQLSVDKDGNIIRIENKTAAMPPVKAEHGQVYNKVFADASGNSYNAQSAVEIIENNNQFVWVEEKGRWFSPDGTRQIWFENRWKYDGGSGVIEEFTVISKYSMRNSYKTSTTGTHSFMQAHHGIQSKNAKSIFGSYYNEADAPVILLRDSFKGTPHEFITNSQNTRISNSYADERKFLLNDLNTLLKNHNNKNEIINRFIREVDNYFYTIYTKMLSDGKSLKQVNEKFMFDFKNKQYFGD